MDARIEKLRLKGIPQQNAVKLVHAGLDVPAKIKAASDSAILALPGIGPAALEQIREIFPKRE